MAGKARKNPNQLAGHRQGRASLAAIAVRTAEDRAANVPQMPTVGAGVPRFLQVTRRAWQLYWTSELSDHVDRTADLYRVERWIRVVDTAERAWRTCQQDWVALGSMGQVRLNPMFKVVEFCEAQLKVAEEQLGMTPLARARLGIAFGEAASALDKLQDAMNEPDEPKGPRAMGNTIEGTWEPL